MIRSLGLPMAKNVDLSKILDKKGGPTVVSSDSANRIDANRIPTEGPSDRPNTDRLLFTPNRLEDGNVNGLEMNVDGPMFTPDGTPHNDNMNAPVRSRRHALSGAEHRKLISEGTRASQIDLYKRTLLSDFGQEATSVLSKETKGSGSTLFKETNAPDSDQNNRAKDLFRFPVSNTSSLQMPTTSSIPNVGTAPKAQLARTFGTTPPVLDKQESSSLSGRDMAAQRLFPSSPENMVDVLGTPPHRMQVRNAARRQVGQLLQAAGLEGDMEKDASDDGMEQALYPPAFFGNSFVNPLFNGLFNGIPMSNTPSTGSSCPSTSSRGSFSPPKLDDIVMGDFTLLEPPCEVFFRMEAVELGIKLDKLTQDTDILQMIMSKLDHEIRADKEDISQQSAGIADMDRRIIEMNARMDMILEDRKAREVRYHEFAIDHQELENRIPILVNQFQKAHDECNNKLTLQQMRHHLEERLDVLLLLFTNTQHGSSLRSSEGNLTEESSDRTKSNGERTTLLLVDIMRSALSGKLPEKSSREEKVKLLKVWKRFGPVQNEGESFQDILLENMEFIKEWQKLMIEWCAKYDIRLDELYEDTIDQDLQNALDRELEVLRDTQDGIRSSSNNWANWKLHWSNWRRYKSRLNEQKNEVAALEEGVIGLIEKREQNKENYAEFLQRETNGFFQYEEREEGLSSVEREVREEWNLQLDSWTLSIQREDAHKKLLEARKELDEKILKRNKIKEELQIKKRKAEKQFRRYVIAQKEADIAKGAAKEEKLKRQVEKQAREEALSTVEPQVYGSIQQFLHEPTQQDRDHEQAVQELVQQFLEGVAISHAATGTSCSTGQVQDCQQAALGPYFLTKEASSSSCITNHPLEPSTFEEYSDDTVRPAASLVTGRVTDKNSKIE